MLTEDIARLCGEIVSLRHARCNMMKDLQQGAKARGQAVGELCTHFTQDRATMAKQTKGERTAFMKDLKKTVNVLRREMSDDLAGARKAWAGRS